MGGARVARPHLPSRACCLLADGTCLCAWALQGVARQGAEAVAVRLGSLLGQAQAQLDGFKTRALRVAAPTQRHLYTTEWRQIDVASGAGAEVLVISDDESTQCKSFSPRAPHAELMAALHNGAWAAIAVAVATARLSLIHI